MDMFMYINLPEEYPGNKIHNVGQQPPLRVAATYIHTKDHFPKNTQLRPMLCLMQYETTTLMAMPNLKAHPPGLP
jgi:hypothetical protein